MPLPDQLKTIVVVMMENRSFDHVLGYLALPQFGGRNDVEGLQNYETDPAFANFYDHQVYRPFSATDGPLPSDLPHARHEVTTQLAFRGKRATMSGFVQAYVELTKSIVQNPPVLGYMTPSDVFMSNFFARNFLICDHWFAPLPADTQPNRAVALTGCSLIDDTKARIIPYRDLVLDWLTQHEVTWRVYHSGLSFFLLFGLMDLVLGEKFRNIRDLPGDLANDDTEEIPQVIFIEPEYNDSPVHFGNIPNDNHPPLAIGPGEHFLRDIYATLSTSPHWANMMLIVTYDEHGGYFDHVPPRPVKSGIPAGAQYSDPFLTTGVRVPAMIASPFVKSGSCYSGTLDHTSILQLFAEKFAGDRRKYSEDVSIRMDQGIESVSSALTTVQRKDVPVAPATPFVVKQLMRSTKLVLNENQKAFTLASHNVLSYNSTQAMRRFPELVHFDESQVAHPPQVSAMVPQLDRMPRIAKPVTRTRLKSTGRRPAKNVRSRARGLKKPLKKKG